MEFTAIDVETANADMSSICQIGLAVCSGESITEEWKSYIDPETFFDAVNVSIHGIDEYTVVGAPRLGDIASRVCEYLEGRIVVCHTHFDRLAIHQAFQKSALHHPHCTWLDSARVTRRAWKEFSRRGYGLHNVCRTLGYEFRHHDALEDAKAAAHVLLAAIQHSGLDLEQWLKRVQQPIESSRPYPQQRIRRAGNPDGPLYGEILAFTGALEMPRREAADMADAVGCQVDSSVTKRTTLLVVGDQDVTRLAGHQKSSKHRKAEELISEGQEIRILRETDFRALIEVTR